FFFQAEDGIRDFHVTGVQTCALPISPRGRGRFAPSPTGPLHFGSLLAAFGSWLAARSAGGEWWIRIEDVDGGREVPGAARDQLQIGRASCRERRWVLSVAVARETRRG